MRVLLAHNRYRVPGGEERHLELLEAELRRGGHEVATFFADSAAADGGLVGRVRTAASMTYRPSSARAIGSVLRSFRPDIVHAHNILPLLTPSILHESKRFGARTILTAHNFRLVCPSGTLVRRGTAHTDCVHGSSLACGIRGAREPWLESLAYGLAIELQRRLRLVARWTDAVVTPAAAVREVLRSAGLADVPIHVVPNAVHVPRWEAQARTHVLYAGRLAREKGIRTLLAAAARVPFPVVVAGTGPLENEVRRATPNVTYAGQLGRSEISTLQRTAAAVVVPSECPDVMPYAVVEALANGTPAVVTSVGGLPELVDRSSGVVCPPADANALAAAMTALWTRSTSDVRHGYGAWLRAKERYDVARRTRELVDLYEAA